MNRDTRGEVRHGARNRVGPDRVEGLRVFPRGPPEQVAFRVSEEHEGCTKGRVRGRKEEKRSKSRVVTFPV